MIIIEEYGIEEYGIEEYGIDVLLRKPKSEVIKRSTIQYFTPTIFGACIKSERSRFTLRGES